LNYLYICNNPDCSLTANLDSTIIFF
jgi:hypothetical protein